MSLAAACTNPVHPAADPSARLATPAIRSNVARGDYAGSDACVPCHADIARAWASSPMHRMTRNARGADVRGPFGGVRWTFKGDAIVLDRRGEDRFVRVETQGEAPKTYRVTRVIGGRTREDYAGIDAERGGEEVVLPVSFVFATGELRYKGYSVMVHERAGLRAGPIWSRACIFCHNTVPELDRLLGAIAGPGRHPYQGERVDDSLPPERRADLAIRDDVAFARDAAEEVARLGGAPLRPGDATRDIAARAIDAVRGGFDGGDLVEVGIGCEACHGGSRDHLRDPRAHPSFSPTAPWLEVALPGAAAAPTEAQAINRACARCHQVLFSRYPFTWEGGRRDVAAGGSHISSGEARDFLLGACSTAMRCTRCHDPHAGSDPSALRVLATPAGNATCTGCHADLADGRALRQHAHHDPSGAGGACIACHMPRKNMGLDGKLTRYHRIGSPTDPARVLGDRPIECALCHVDRTVRQLVDSMERWWPVRYPRQRLEELYGSLEANVARATLDRGKAHEKAVAIALLSEAGARDAVPMISRELASEYPLIREWAFRALATLGAAPPPPAGATGGRQPPVPGPDEDPED